MLATGHAIGVARFGEYNRVREWGHRAPFFVVTRATPLQVSAIAGLVAIAVLGPGLGSHGIWSADELLVLDRTRAALGAGASGLARSPWLPDALRTWTYGMSEGAAALRLPHAIACAGLVALAAGIARWRGMSGPVALLAGALALAFPILGLSGRTALGNPIGELLVALAVVGGTVAVNTPSRSRALTAALAGLACAGLAVSAVGLGLGLAVPLATIAAIAAAGSPNDSGKVIPRSLRLALVTAALVVVGVTVMLSMRQGDGYVPILGAAKDLELIDKPHLHRFAGGFADFGYQLFPWTPLVVVGALTSDRDRLGPTWLACALVGAVAWSVVYGTTSSLVVIPAALCGASVIERLSRPETPAVWRRLAIAATVGGILVLGKDAQLSPDRIIAALSDYPGGHTFPDDALHGGKRLGRLRSFAALALLLAGLVTVRRGRLATVLGRMPNAARTALTATVVGLAALSTAVLYSRGLVPDLSALVSPRAVLENYQSWVSADALPDQLGTHRVRDRGMGIYGPDNVEVLAGRSDATKWLSADEPRVALIRARDLAPIHMNHRHQDWPLFVLDRSHASLMLVANVLPEGATDLNPIPDVLLEAPPPMRHETLLRFENYIEIVGWQVTEPIIRGGTATIEIAIKVLRPLPGGCKLYTRLLKGRSSRMAVDPQPLAMDLYPPNLWREGDFILHQYEFKVPPLEIQWGPHELIVGLRRSETKNIEISAPEGKKGEFGVRIRGSKRTFATLGTVQVY